MEASGKKRKREEVASPDAADATLLPTPMHVTLNHLFCTAIRDGLAADEPIPGLLHAILDRAHDGLKARGRGEEVYLAPLRARVERRRNPGQEAVAVLT